MIQRKIHYCWFGRIEKPEIVNKCINSWKENAKGYELVEWNEDNFDINSNDFVREAYEKKKYAFVSDYVRAYALFNYGGIYLDTDVELLKDFDDYLENDSFFGFEAANYIATSTIGARKGNKVIKKLLDKYQNKKFINKDGTLDTVTNVFILSDIFKDLKIERNGKYQKKEGLLTVYPMEVFSPYDYRFYQDLRTENTVSIHHFHKSWVSKKDKIKQSIKKLGIRLLGVNNIKKLTGVK
ncbi:glycosyltransferase family 32 protein [Clostridium chrysemydis]|uniref:glycosyltransferase family 32 protein n=1 Tax=Clostridium chrysemydis TaxID=2665504 RepID=UPI001883B137|nr:capsular polysaccharide synthesis protein [Clostridium chrysemydis]